nr:hypothetical protein [Tanacetum cinerariifolium]
MSKRARSTRGKPPHLTKRQWKFGLFDHEDHQINYNNLVGRSIYLGDVVDWELLYNKGLAQSFFNSINTDAFSGPQWRESRVATILSDMRNVKTVNSSHFTPLFWPNIGDEGFNVGNIKAKSIRDRRIKLAHRCITMTIAGRKETTNCVPEIDLFFLYCIYGEGFVCNIPYWLTKYLKGIKDKSVIFERMFVTKIAWSFGLLTDEMVSVLNREPPPHVYRKTSLVKIGVIMELYGGECC